MRIVRRTAVLRVGARRRRPAGAGAVRDLRRRCRCHGMCGSPLDGCARTAPPGARRILRQFTLTATATAPTTVQQQQHPPPPPPAVVIVGGGPAGLFLSHLLTDHRVAHVLLEQHCAADRCFQHPQAHFLNTRTMELLLHHQHGGSSNGNGSNGNSLHGAVQRHVPPVRQWRDFSWGAHLAAPPLAVTRHPVGRPLRAASDANGALLPPRNEEEEEEDCDGGGDATEKERTTVMERDATTTTTYGTTNTAATASATSTTADDFTTRSTTASNGFAPSPTDLSPCSVGHLAQHTFGKILHWELLRKVRRQQQQQPKNDSNSNSNNNNITRLCYNARVERVEWLMGPDDGDNSNRSPTPPPLLRVTAADGRRWDTDLVVAADGAHSAVRRQPPLAAQLNARDGPAGGGADGADQHLVNLHVTVPRAVAERYLLRHHNRNHSSGSGSGSMLHSVFSPAGVAMVVCHSVGEYVVQIPYFPPYQTLEADFGPAQIQRVWLPALFGATVAPHCTVRSVRPWTMTSWVARHYYYHSSRNNNSNGADAAVVLAGDAAHVFPPAGGLGMNTGLQDVHNLAAKIAEHRYRNGNNRNGDGVPWSTLLAQYQGERQGVARENAALSLRNYRRTLRVTRQAHLDHRHPALLCGMLDRAAPLLPLEARRSAFRALLRAALSPLRWLQDDGDDDNDNNDNNHAARRAYRKHIQSNLRRILQTGGGLPLLFPRFEIGYVYDCMNGDQNGNSQSNRTERNRDESGNNNNDRHSLDWRSDTWAAPPELRVGGLVPHVYVRVLNMSKNTNDDNGSKQQQQQLQQWFPRLHLYHHHNDDDNASTVMMSTTDLPAQMMMTTVAAGPEDDFDADSSQGDGAPGAAPRTIVPPCYVLLWVTGQNRALDKNMLESVRALARARQRTRGLPVRVAVLLVGADDDNGNDNNNNNNKAEQVSLPSTPLPSTDNNDDGVPPVLFLSEPPRPEPAFAFARGRPSPPNYGLLIRADGHIAEILEHEDAS